MTKGKFLAGTATTTGYAYLYSVTDLASKYLLKSAPDGLIDKILWGVTNAPAYLAIGATLVGGAWVASKLIPGYLRKKSEGEK
ncbi:MAG: hypothetical protein GTN40_05295 [Candidatus Aenigmarchaeota archaeon]|nr:hypothetical protein [Candidatus Aenigmarchaeota archaeon]